jgi:hypothetical protein
LSGFAGLDATSGVDNCLMPMVMLETAVRSRDGRIG